MLVARSLSTVMEGNGVKLQVMNRGPMPILGKTSSVKHSIKTHGPLIRQPIRQFPERTQDSRCCQCNWCSWPHPGTPYFVCNVDGVEDLKVGLDLYEFSEVIIALGWWHAANLNGGGSSVSVYKGTVVSQPTCEDVPLICERAVTSITCMQP
eukprot:Em0023g702a